MEMWNVFFPQVFRNRNGSCTGFGLSCGKEDTSKMVRVCIPNVESEIIKEDFYGTEQRNLIK